MRGKDRTILWLILDGMADRPAPVLDNQTPLEAATTPNLDHLADSGVNGLMDVSRPGTPLSSDRAHTLLFGYHPDEVPGRGVLEAIGFDIEIPSDAVVCSASFGRIAATNGSWTITDRHLRDADIDYPKYAERITPYRDSNTTISFAYTWKNRGIVTLEPTNGSLSPAVTDVDPFGVDLPIIRPEPLATATNSEAARRTADALVSYTRWTITQLSKTPVDVVLSKWAGTPRSPPPFQERHGLKACSLTPKPVLRGLAETLGIAVKPQPTAYEDRPSAILNAVDSSDFIHVHYPEPDEVAHAAGPEAKRDELEAIDATLDPVVTRALEDDELVTVVTADHTTPSGEDVVHSGEPVPVTMVADSVRQDDVSTAGERPASNGGLGHIRGTDLLRMSRAVADRVLLDGLRRSPAEYDYPNQSLTPLSREEN